MSLATMKKSNSLDKLLGAVETENKPQEKKSYVDERIWKPTMDKTGNGFAIIRFLPETNGEDILWAKYYRHEFKGQNGWIMDNCPTSIAGQKCPICEANSALWTEGGDENEKLARERKRKLKYIFNILVVKWLAQAIWMSGLKNCMTTKHSTQMR